MSLRAFVHEVRTFLAEPESKEKLGNIRQFMEGRHAGQEKDKEVKAASEASYS
jgi:hypothetical protein